MFEALLEELKKILQSQNFDITNKKREIYKFFIALFENHDKKFILQFFAFKDVKSKKSALHYALECDPEIAKTIFFDFYCKYYREWPIIIEEISPVPDLLFTSLIPIFPTLHEVIQFRNLLSMLPEKDIPEIYTSEKDTKNIADTKDRVELKNTTNSNTTTQHSNIILFSQKKSNETAILEAIKSIAPETLIKCILFHQQFSPNLQVVSEQSQIDKLKALLRNPCLNEYWSQLAFEQPTRNKTSAFISMKPVFDMQCERFLFERYIDLNLILESLTISQQKSKSFPPYKPHSNSPLFKAVKENIQTILQKGRCIESFDLCYAQCVLYIKELQLSSNKENADQPTLDSKQLIERTLAMDALRKQSDAGFIATCALNIELGNYFRRLNTPQDLETAQNYYLVAFHDFIKARNFLMQHPPELSNVAYLREYFKLQGPDLRNIQGLSNKSCEIESFRS